MIFQQKINERWGGVVHDVGYRTSELLSIIPYKNHGTSKK